jgi:precorrin isomerase
MDEKNINLAIAMMESIIRHGPTALIEAIRLMSEEEITPEAIRNLKVKPPSEFIKGSR